jgi:hypothetical protein
MASIINSQPVFVFRHGFRQDEIHPVDPPIFPIGAPTNVEQQKRLIELESVINFVVSLKKPVIVVNSPFKRCRETAAFAVNMLMVKGVRQLSIQIDYDWTEVGNIALMACNRNDINSFLPYPIEAISNESHDDANKRFNDTFDKYLAIAKENDCVVLVFSHGDAVANIIQNEYEKKGQHKTIYSVPPLSWIAKYADNVNKFAWCDDIGIIDTITPYTLNAFIGTTNDITTNDITTNDITANDIVANDITANDIVANDIVANDVVNNDDERATTIDLNHGHTVTTNDELEAEFIRRAIEKSLSN